MNEVKTFEELKEELGIDYDKKLYEMGVSAMNEITRLNNIIDELEKWLKEDFSVYICKARNNGKSIELGYKICQGETLDKLKELKEGK